MGKLADRLARHPGAAALAWIAWLVAPPAPAVECGLRPAFEQADHDAPGGRTTVWAEPGGGPLYFGASLLVNTDGTRRSYSLDDFWGTKRALNNLCNAMRDYCSGLDAAGLRERRLSTQRAHAEGWPAEALERSRLSPMVLPFRDGRPCPPVDGFLVSSTALWDPEVADVCDLRRYVDALVVPALVVPRDPAGGRSGFTQRGVAVGDLAVALRPGAAEPVFAVVGDTGPADRVGEGSVALNGRLLGYPHEPESYAELVGHGRFAGRGWNVPHAELLIFPHSRDAERPYLSVARIDAAAKQRFEAWGGAARLRACAEASRGPAAR